MAESSGLERAARVLKHLSQEPCAGRAVDDVVVLSAVRTPIGKARRGSFKDTPPDDLLATVLKAATERAGLRPEQVGDICVGNVLLENSAFMARVGQLLAGFPETVPVQTVNRQCSSGLQAVLNVAGAIQSGMIDFGIGAGVESMTRRDMGGGVKDLNPKIMEHDKARQCLVPMGITSENVAERFGISRQKQDELAALSHARAAHAQEHGFFDAEIVPTPAVTVDADGEVTGSKMITKDDGVRPGTTAEKLAKLKPAFQADGSTTAGNSSQVSDGAAAVVLASRKAAEAAGLPIAGALRAWAVVGVEPDVMGIGPAVAIPAALKNAGLTVADIDVFEINEAFASQATYCVEKLGIPLAKVNPNGGAIALGHPLGCTGARQVATAFAELKRRGKPGLACISMCIGTGMGLAAIFEVYA